MKTLNISLARNTLPALVDSVSATHAPVVLLRYGKPAAMLVPRHRATRTDEPASFARRTDHRCKRF